MNTATFENISSQPETIWIIGGGKFGQHAVRLLHNKSPSAKMIVIDHKPIVDLPSSVEIVCADGVDWLSRQPFLESMTKIIPVIPVHLAADCLKMKLRAEGKKVYFEGIPENLLNHLPHSIRLSPDKIVTSHADFICPETCSEPDRLCSFTHQLRPPPLYSLLQEMQWQELTPLIIRSRQFAPGVGGFFLKDIWNLFDQAKSLPGVPLVIGTACKCHGVLDSFSSK